MSKIANIIDRITGANQKADPLRKVKVLTDLSIRAQGTTIHAAAGDVVEVRESELNQLDPSDYEVTNKKTSAAVADPSPARPEPAPLPAAWISLPKCFADWWELKEKFRVAAEHPALIDKARLEVLGVTTSLAGGEGTLLAMRPMQVSTQNRNIEVNTRILDLSDPVTRKLDAYLTAAKQAALDHLDEVMQKLTSAKRKAWLECGMHLLDLAEEVTVTFDELQRTALEAFSIRLAPLELHPSHVARLYAGSGMYSRYSDGRCGGNAGDTQIAGTDEAGCAIIFCGDDCEHIAALYAMNAARLAELRPLLQQAKAELAAATKVHGKAA